MAKINWGKILGSAGITFFSVLATVSFIEKDLLLVFKISIIPAIIQACLVICKSLEDNGESKTSKAKGIAKVLDVLTVS